MAAKALLITAGVGLLTDACRLFGNASGWMDFKARNIESFDGHAASVAIGRLIDEINRQDGRVT